MGIYDHILTPKMESNFRFQVQQIKKERLKNPTLVYPSITISREFGCEGYPLAAALSAKLSKPGKNWVIYSKELNRSVDMKIDYENELREIANDESRNMMEQFLSEMLAHKPTDYLKFKENARNVHLLCHTGLAIIVGGGGAIITQHRQQVFHVRLIASEAYRTRRLAEKLDLNDQEALHTATSGNQSRIEYIQRITKKDVTDPSLYHLVLNNDHFDADEMAEIIVAAMRTKKFNLP